MAKSIHASRDGEVTVECQAMGTAADRELRQEGDGRGADDFGLIAPEGINAERLLAWGVLGVAVIASATLILGLNSQLTFIADDWELLVARNGLSLSTVFEPFHENIVIGPALVYKVLQGSFGMSSAMPFYVASISLFSHSRISWAFIACRLLAPSGSELLVADHEPGPDRKLRRRQPSVRPLAISLSTTFAGSPANTIFRCKCIWARPLFAGRIR